MGEQGLAAPQKSHARERRAGQIGALGLGGKQWSAPNKQTRRGLGCSHSPSLKGLRIFDGAPNLFLAAPTLRQASGITSLKLRPRPAE